MSFHDDKPLAGVLRSVYFLAVALAGIFVVVTAVFSFYEPPESGGGPFFESRGGFEEDGFGFQAETFREESERGDYNRNVSLILAVISAGVLAAAILGLGSRFNPLRAGLVAAGLVLFLLSVGFWSDASDDWIGFVTSLLVFAVLAGGYPFLEDGLPLRMLEPRPVRRLEVPPATPSPPVPGPEEPPPVPPTDEEPPHPHI